AEVRVALCVGRSIEALVGLLAILKAGGAYVPIERDTPEERVRFILRDSAASVLITEKELAETWTLPEVRMLCIDSVQDSLLAQPEHAPSSKVRADNLAYVIYTSGSTGRPKGVMVQHRSAHHLWEGLRRAVLMDETQPLRVGINAPLSFDVSVGQIFQLLSGHTVYPISAETRRDGSALLDLVARERIDVLDCTPTHLRMLLASGLREFVKDHPLHLLVAGEAFDQGSWSVMAEYLPGRTFNLYGPTECTVYATGCAVSASASSTIGRPLPQVEAFVLDTNLQPLPPGIPGELCLGGAAVARGYLGRPGLTAERFVPNPLSDRAGERLYRTGDRVRWRDDGQLEYLGRLDRQVKVRGYRIELGEIEATLNRDPGVRESVVICRELKPGDRRLFAYVTAQPGHELDIEALRAAARDRLPAYMVPTAFVTLDEMPLNQSGKIDHRALPEPQVVSLVG
ncbi:MAG: amino acid adenylation domain-containing protein, partial [Myxococcota bacterium]